VPADSPQFRAAALLLSQWAEIGLRLSLLIHLFLISLAETDRYLCARSLRQWSNIKLIDKGDGFSPPQSAILGDFEDDLSRSMVSSVSVLAMLI
jgi:hypothetical protein